MSKKRRAVKGVIEDYSEMGKDYKMADEKVSQFNAPVKKRFQANQAQQNNFEEPASTMERQRRPSKMGPSMIKNKFKQMKSQEAIYDYMVVTQQQHSKDGGPVNIGGLSAQVVEEELDNEEKRRINRKLGYDVQKLPKDSRMQVQPVPPPILRQADFGNYDNMPLPPPSIAMGAPISIPAPDQQRITREHQNEVSERAIQSNKLLDSLSGADKDDILNRDKQPEPQRQDSLEQLVFPNPAFPVATYIYGEGMNMQKNRRNSGEQIVMPSHNIVKEDSQWEGSMILKTEPADVGPNIKNLDYNLSTHENYLKGVTTFLNLENDIGLYSLDRAIGSNEIGVAGIHILSPDLRKEYGNKKYMLRAYISGAKRFEYLLGKLFFILAIVLSFKLYMILTISEYRRIAKAFNAASINTSLDPSIKQSDTLYN
ncbi:hypothetical protein FGO68_gene2720 [Halteria grandinella]|uniref:Uncharacterized protein n=1 Tax=Halteria grandinella TaxID=5974 RepID=A0A8J8NE58_HALGN|nr:hypothetical protein FGO68_gene2720 [Halteria grandinella]